MPPIVHHAIDINATPDACWRAFADLSNWPRWFPMCSGARALDGDPWRLGGRIEIQFNIGMKMAIAVEVKELDPTRRVRWIGGRLGMSGNHSYDFAVNSPGLTRVTSHEEFTGMAANWMPRAIVDRIDGEVHRSMERLKALVEGSRA